MVRKHPCCGFAPEQVCEGLETASKSTTSEELFLREIGSEKKVSLRGVWEILRGIPHLSNVTYLPPKEGNMGLHLRLHVLRLSLTESFTCVIYLVIAFVLEVSCIII